MPKVKQEAEMMQKEMQRFSNDAENEANRSIDGEISIQSLLKYIQMSSYKTSTFLSNNEKNAHMQEDATRKTCVTYNVSERKKLK